MQKIFVEDKQINENRVEIFDVDFNHIVNVLKMKNGEELQVGNKNTLDTYLARIEEISNDRVILEIIEKLENNESNVKVDLYQGLPKFDKMELIIQKTTEIGVNRIIPTDMTRCIVKLDEKDYKKKQERWQKIAESAAGQSKRGMIPEIDNKIKLKEIINKISEYDRFIVAYEEENENTLKNELKNIELKDEYKIGVLVGPEGGITKEEIELLKDAGAKIVTLGKRILRTETAPIVLASNIIYELEN